MHAHLYLGAHTFTHCMLITVILLRITYHYLYLPFVLLLPPLYVYQERGFIISIPQLLLVNDYIYIVNRMSTKCISITTRLAFVLVIDIPNGGTRSSSCCACKTKLLKRRNRNILFLSSIGPPQLSRSN